MEGRIVQINISRGGVPKRPVARGIITPLGLEGDACAHPEIHGGPRQAVLIIASEVIEDLAARGFPVTYGSLGENLTTSGLDVSQIRIGQVLRAGNALLEVTKIRRPCATLDVYGNGIQKEIFDRQVKDGDVTSPRWAWSGFYTSVLEPGLVHPGDPISIELTLA
jgi:MOSC domain-containing protein YiiM